jgi:PPOX class probable F420-dependent enzyme
VTEDEARARFESARVARLATADADGMPHIVPIVFAIDGDRIVTAIDGKRKRGGALRRLENITVNPRVSVLVDAYDEDWSQLWWARADGTASIQQDGELREHAHRLLRNRYSQYDSVPLGGRAVIIDVDRWSGWVA